MNASMRRSQNMVSCALETTLQDTKISESITRTSSYVINEQQALSKIRKHTIIECKIILQLSLQNIVDFKTMGTNTKRMARALKFV